MWLEFEPLSPADRTRFAQYHEDLASVPMRTEDRLEHMHLLGLPIMPDHFQFDPSTQQWGIMKADCTCDDFRFPQRAIRWGNQPRTPEQMCKHQAAVVHKLAACVDGSIDTLFTLRGVDPHAAPSIHAPHDQAAGAQSSALVAAPTAAAKEEKIFSTMEKIKKTVASRAADAAEARAGKSMSWQRATIVSHKREREEVTKVSATVINLIPGDSESQPCELDLSDSE